ncbi:BlaI/MecI/CopY family transcriptional regulator [Singulisphaera sp. Ch08]|uniref:BlaI/MecI/CopY family transcriptional regulator n=1 Tax=Singulisphaera sp. Ch08 TaxID=3120278 RepID=A0AAU7CIH0_9BACT
MAGRKVVAITERQFAVLRVLWEHGPQTVRGLMEHLPRGESQPYTTVLGLLQVMEKAKLVDHEKEGLTHRYRPLVSQQEATGSLLSDFLSRFFHGSAEQLILGLVDAEQLGADELRAIEARLKSAEERTSSGHKDEKDQPGGKRGRTKR